MKKNALLSLALGTLLSFSANAAFVEANFATLGGANNKFISFDTKTKLGWLDLNFTRGMSYNSVLNLLKDERFAGFRLPTLQEHESMVRTVFPSLYSATSFDKGHPGVPQVNTTESAYYRKLFNNVGDYTYGMAYDPKNHSVHWSASNPWGEGQFAYTNWYEAPNGRPITNNDTHPLNHSDFAWYLVSNGKVDLDGSFSLQAADVNAPLLPLTGGLVLFALGSAALCRKQK